jgi:hypothetical protein
MHQARNAPTKTPCRSRKSKVASKIFLAGALRA